MDDKSDDTINAMMLTQLYFAMGEELPKDKLPEFLQWGDDTKDYFAAPKGAERATTYAGRESATLANARKYNNREIFEPN